MNVKDLGIISPEEGLEAEHALFREGSGMIIYTRDVPTVSLGRFTDIDACVDIRYAAEHDIRIIRRMSGGSAVYTDRGQMVFSLVTARDSFGSKSESYEVLCNCLVRTLAHLGVDAVHKIPNDVLAGGRKISGCAQYRDRDRLLHHGTLILDLNDNMEKVLRPVKVRTYSGMTSVRMETGRIPDRKEILEAFREGFSAIR